MTTAIIVAAGKSARMGGDVDKAFLSLGPKPVLAYSLMTFEACPDIDKIVLVVRKDQLVAAKSASQMFGCRKVAAIVAQRQQTDNRLQRPGRAQQVAGHGLGGTDRQGVGPLAKEAL